VLLPGAALGIGLTPEAARELGLPSGIAVAASLIDAHAGGLGNLFFRPSTGSLGSLTHRLLPRTQAALCLHSKGQG
jgi:ribulose kinase